MPEHSNLMNNTSQQLKSLVSSSLNKSNKIAPYQKLLAP